MRKLYPSCDFYISLTDVLSRDDISGVVIATPAETHFMLARKVLQSSKHVFVEKPLTLSGKDAEELIALAQKKNLVLMVGHLLPVSPCFYKIETTGAGRRTGQNKLYILSPFEPGKNQKGRKYFMVFRPA
jgi:UDP-2-acetamido-3-amino-2,3-dideoxy-glucuronate N-acetyltransferase